MTSAPLRLTRQRFKAAREGKQVESPAAHASKLVAILTPAAQSDPAPASRAYAQYVTDAFSNRLLSLCGAYPVKARRP
jgi:hypothetical protein